MPLVPNHFPTLLPTLDSPRLALVGEAPGEHEVNMLQPFVGKSGGLLSFVLSRAGVARDSCLLAYCCQYRPPIKNNISLFAWDGEEFKSGLAQLKADIYTFNPNIIVLLGNVPLKAALDPLTIHPLVPGRYKYSNSNYRGSLFNSHPLSPFAGRKCISTLHPAYVLRVDSHRALFDFDIRKAVRESRTPIFIPPTRNIDICYEPDVAIRQLRAIRKFKQPVALDTEGIEHMSCISFALSKSYAFVIPFFLKDGKHCFTIDDEVKIFRELALTLEDSSVPKIIQNTLHDVFLLHYYYGIRVQNVADDTMLKHWELYSEIPKALAVQTSIYTNQPYYKGDRASQDNNTFFRYCAMDSLVTFEINEKLERWVVKTARKHYDLNISLLAPLRYMELHGIKYDITKAKDRRAHVRSKMFEQQALLNGLAGFGLTWSKGFNEIFNAARNRFCLKRAVAANQVKSFNDIITCCKLGPENNRFPPQARRLVELINQPLSLSSIGEIEDLCGSSLNEGSSEQICKYLYETIKLPKQYKKAKRNTSASAPEATNDSDDEKSPSLTADYEALLKLSTYCKLAPANSMVREYQIIRRVIDIRAMDTRQRMLGIEADEDGRIRCGYNVVGSETGRVTCYTSPTGSGYNIQTIPKYTKEADAPGGVLGDRDLFIADTGSYLFQCDLSGADGWTVAAYCAMLGDDTMLEDYRAGLKPAKLLALFAREVSREINWNDRRELKERQKLIDSESDEYFIWKKNFHAVNYLEGPSIMAKTILTESLGKITVTERECSAQRNLIFCRYPGIQRWHNFIASQIKQRPFLTTASGQVRQFFGPAKEILPAAVAHEPQANTTYATNLALHRLWVDADNRNNGHLKVVPLHQVHDALVGLFKIQDTAWAVDKIKSWFNNPLNIAGYTIVIPFEGGYGRSWGELNNEI